MKLKIEKEVFDLFPKSGGGLVEYIAIVKGANVESKRSREILDRSRKIQEQLRGELQDKDINNIPQFAIWNQAYANILDNTDAGEKFKANFDPSHVALAKRIAEGNDLPNVNPLVNHYNMISIEYKVPIGAEDLSTYYGDLALKVADGGEKYLGIGKDKIVEVRKGEVHWIDDYAVCCRMWNWRQSERTKVTRKSRDIIFYIDLDYKIHEEFIKWAKEGGFKSDLEKFFGAQVEEYWLDEESSEVEIDYESKEISDLDQAIEEDIKKYLSSKKIVGNKGLRKRKPDTLGFSDPKHLTNHIEELVSAVLEDENYTGQSNIQFALNQGHGDLSSTIALANAKELKKAPKVIADEIVAKLQKNEQVNNIFSEITAAPNGFINFKLSDKYVVEKLSQVATKGDQFGHSEVGSGKTILVESPGWNPNKAPHIGHILNLFLGKSLLRLFNAVGLNAQNDDIDNDKGMPIMEAIWAYQKADGEPTPESEGLRPDHFIHKYYLIGREAFFNDETAKAEINEILRKWEAEDPEIREVWKKIVGWAREGQFALMRRLGEEPGFQWHESEVYSRGKSIVKEGVDKGLVDVLPDGAHIVRLEEEYGLPDTIVLKSDGSGLYHTQDIYLTVKKMEKFQPWKIIWVVAEEQIAHFQRLFAILDKLGIMPIDNLYHYAYSWVVDKDGGKLSSRDGADLTADELLDKMEERALQIVEDRDSKKDLEQKEKVAHEVAVGAVKYAYLSSDPFKQIKFDMEKALSFSGKSGPYIMYAYTRAKSVLENSKISVPDSLQGLDIEMSAEDRSLALMIFKYPEVVLSAANNYAPHILAEYLYDLAKEFNNFYENVRVLDSQGDMLKFRLGLLKVVAETLKSGLEILGINVLEEM